MYKSFVSWVSALPAPVRHFAAVFLGSAITIIGAHLVSDSSIDWASLLKSTLVESGTAGLVAVGVLAATPLTSSYGVHKDVH